MFWVWWAWVRELLGFWNSEPGWVPGVALHRWISSRLRKAVKQRQAKQPGPVLDDTFLPWVCNIPHSDLAQESSDDYSWAEKWFSGSVTSEFIGVLNTPNLSRFRATCDSFQFSFCAFILKVYLKWKVNLLQPSIFILLIKKNKHWTLTSATFCCFWCSLTTF